MSLLKLSHQVTQCHPAWQEDWRVRSETASSLLLLHRHFSHHHLSVAGRRWTGISPERGETWLSRLPSVRPGLGFFSTPSPGSKDRPQAAESPRQAGSLQQVSGQPFFTPLGPGGDALPWEGSRPVELSFCDGAESGSSSGTSLLKSHHCSWGARDHCQRDGLSHVTWLHN